MGKRINVVFVSDEAYVVPLAAAIESICTHLDDRRDTDIFVLDLGLSAESRQRLQTMASGCRRLVRVEFVPIERNLLPAECARPGLAAAFAKLWIPDALPSDCSRAVYLDADVILGDDIGLLHDMDLHGYPVGACRHCWLTDGHAGLERSGHLRDTYFNSGVMVLDLDRWRAERIGPTALALAASEGFMFNDQDALNVVLESRWRQFPHRWNVMYLHMDPVLVRDELLRSSPDVFSEADLDAMEKNPGVMHFGIPIALDPSVVLAAGTAFSKPWSYWGTHPERERFFEHVDRTPWRGYRWSARTVVDAAASEFTEISACPGGRYAGELANALRSKGFVNRVRSAQDGPPPGLEAAIRFFAARRTASGSRRLGPSISDVLETGDDQVGASVDYLARFCAEVRRGRPDFDVESFARDLAARIADPRQPVGVG